MKRLLALLLALFLLCGCSAKPVTAQGFAMDTILSVSLYQGGSQALAQEALSLADEAEARLSCHREGTEISRLNQEGSATLSPETAELLKKIRGRYPVFGICLGHQLAGLAYGAKTFKLKFGHRGGNHPVRNLETGRLEITSQNHSYAIDRDSLSGTGLKVTHENLLDGTVEGMECVKDRLFTVQFHPESAPGPQDSGYLFDKFVRLMAANKKD